MLKGMLADGFARPDELGIALDVDELRGSSEPSVPGRWGR